MKKRLEPKIISALALFLILPLFVFANPDLNSDDRVDIDDLIIVASNFGLTSGFDQRADTDDNDVIDIFDVVYVASNFGTIEPPPPPPPNGDLVYAASLSPSDTQAAVDRASSGDTIILPEGDYHGFDTTVYIPNGISMKGQGVDKTIIRKDSNSGVIFRWNRYNPQPGPPIEISGITLEGYGYKTTTYTSGIMLYNDMKDFVIHDMRFENFSSTGISVNGDSRGVVYDCFFQNIVPGDLSQSGYGVGIIGDETWDDPKPALGTQDMVFMEDNHFINCKHGVATSAGSHHVFRYNSVEGWTVSRHLVDAHGKNDPWAVGSNTWEVYKNTLKCTGRDDITDWGITHRGGSGVIWDNTITGCDPKTGPGTPSKAISFTVDEFSSYPDPYQIKDTYVWGNTHDGQPLAEVWVTSKALDYIKEDREYFRYQKPGYTPYPYPHPLRGEAGDNIVYAASGSREDIQAAVDAAEDGDTVQIPAGTYALEGTVFIQDKSLHIKGAGKTLTILERNIEDGNNKAMFYVPMYGQESFEFSDMTLHDKNGPYETLTNAQWTRGIHFNYGVWDLYVHDMKFEGFGYAGVACYADQNNNPSVTWGKERGVVADCEFVDCYAKGLGYGVLIVGRNDDVWNEDPGKNLGSDEFIFVEDCTFDNTRHAVTIQYGGRGVGRYNTITNHPTNARSLDVHGADANTWAGYAWEYYENNMASSTGATGGGVGINGGTGVIWNNALTTDGGSNHYVGLQNSYDQGVYPAKTQVADVYVWGNTVDGDPAAINILAEDEFYIQEDRDYFTYQMPGYTPYTYPHPLRST